AGNRHHHDRLTQEVDGATVEPTMMHTRLTDLLECEHPVMLGADHRRSASAKRRRVLARTSGFCEGRRIDLPGQPR
ncbi:MAG TPA: hypothetical protein PLV41_06890, partial [Miltoncostaeales bacterium]|nr:hypothetical protein [Miltoncostaeales bacterium]